MENVKSILENLGYRLLNDGKFWRARPIYRDSNNPTSLRVSKSTGHFIDFSIGKKGSFEELIQLSLNLKNVKEAKDWLGTRSFQKIEFERPPIIEVNPKWDVSVLHKFVPDHSYWEKRGISFETAKVFQGGLFKEWKMNNRYVFPIFDYHKNQIIGFSGRDLGNGLIKWKHIGRKYKWVWPAHLNRDLILEKKEVVLVESPACVLKLWDCGIKNVVCLFGTEISDSIICFLVGVQPDKILISTNNEPDNENIGNIAATKIEKRLSCFLNPNQIIIAFPFKKDFAEMDNSQIKTWQNSYLKVEL